MTTTTRTKAKATPATADETQAAVQANDTPEARDAEFWHRLTEAFPADEIELLPRPFSKDNPKATCNAQHADRDGNYCGGYHAQPAVHLSYVGHAGITTRLNEVCGPDGWDWEPFTLTPEGLPGIRPEGLWIRLTIVTPSGKAVSKIGFGDAPGKSNATKELIGDAIRNAAMRFGIGTYLWSKSDRAKATLERGDATTQTAHQEPSSGPRSAPEPEAQAFTPHAGIEPLEARIGALNPDQRQWLVDQWKAKGWPPLRQLPEGADEQAEAISALIKDAEDQPPF